MNEQGECFSNNKSSVSGYCLAFSWFFFGQFQPGIVYKSGDYKKSVHLKSVAENFRNLGNLFISS